VDHAWWIAATVAIAAFTPAAHAAGTTAVAFGVAGATIVQPISVTQTADLDFGAIVGDRQQGGSVTIAPDGSGAAYAGGASAVPGYAPAHAAGFAVSGEAGRAYTISAPATLTITGEMLSGGAAPSLTIAALRVRTASRPASGPAGLLGADGRDSFAVGGTLVLPAAATPAHYRASLPVIVTYG